jgi:hypothetical protein
VHDEEEGKLFRPLLLFRAKQKLSDESQKKNLREWMRKEKAFASISIVASRLNARQFQFQFAE